MMTTPIPKGFTSVMAGRIEPPAALDFFPTPPWATRTLIHHVFPKLGIDIENIGMIWEPACGEGHMAAVLAEISSAEVIATDIFDYGFGKAPVDFLNREPYVGSPDWIITNPPFKVALEFALRALDLAHRGVALLVRTVWLEGGERYKRLFGSTPPTVFAHSPRGCRCRRAAGIRMAPLQQATLGLSG
jgi:hypothetical protein